MSESRTSTGFVLLCALTVAVGSYVPWARPNPAQDSHRLPIFSKAEAGIELVSVFTLVPVVLVVALLALRVTGRLLSVALLGTGGTVTLIALFYVWELSLVGFDGSFVPAAGWYLTLGAGFVLLVLGAGRLFIPERSRKKSQEGGFDAG